MKTFRIFVESVANVIGAGHIAGVSDVGSNVSDDTEGTDDTQNDIMRNIGRLRSVVAGTICLKIRSSDISTIKTNNEYIQLQKSGCPKIVVCYKDTHQYFMYDMKSETIINEFYPTAEDFNEHQG